MGARDGTSEGSLPGGAGRARLARIVGACAVVATAALAVAGPAPAGVERDAPLEPHAVYAITISAVASPATVPRGSGFKDAATLTPTAGGPAPTGTISFSVYGPTDPGCAGPVLFNSANTLGGATTTSGSYTPPDTGTYRVTATYSGDGNYGSVSTACADPTDSVTVGLRPTLTALSPPSGPAAGGTAVTITGANLSGASAVDFGSVAVGVSVVNSTEVTASAPPGSGSVDVTVTTPFGTTATSPADAFTFVAAPVIPPPITVTPANLPPPPNAETGPAKDVTSSSAELTGTVDPEGLAAAAYFEYTVHLPGGAAKTVRTPVTAVGSDLTSHPVTAAVTGLVAGSRYRVRIVATSASGSTVADATTFTTLAGPASTPTTAPPSTSGTPVLARTVDADPTRGVVYFRLAGIGRTVKTLATGRILPVDTTFDTRHGDVRLTVAATRGKLASGEFTKGQFTFFQAVGTGQETVLALVRPSTVHATCAAAAGKSEPTLATLHASVGGSFEVRGRDSETTGGAGATWTTTDRCDGTLTTVEDGAVKVDDFGRRRTVVVRAGHSYLAKAR
jgi:hypothetical protein